MDFDLDGVPVVFSRLQSARATFIYDAHGLIINGCWWAAASSLQRREAINHLVGGECPADGRVYGNVSMERVASHPLQLSSRLADIPAACWEQLIMTDPPAP